MSRASNKLLSFVKQTSVMVNVINDVIDLCFQYNIDYNDKLLKQDVDRLCQYYTLMQVVTTISDDAQFTIIVNDPRATAKLCKLVNDQTQFSVKPIVQTMRFLNKTLQHRFIELLDLIPSQPTDYQSLSGELKDKVEIALSKPPNNLSKIKKFVDKHKLIDIADRFDQSIMLNKTLTFL